MSVTLPVFPDVQKFGRLLELNERLPVLITGIAGVSGFNAFAYLRQKYGDQVIGQRPENNWPLSGDGIVGINLTNEQELRALFAKHKFRSVINCGGSCALKGCELDPDMAQRVNVRSLQSLAKVISEFDPAMRFIHLSIDLVYSGTHGGKHVEQDPTDPVTVYGTTMAEAEQLLMETLPATCILRISLPMGISFNGHAGAIDWIESRFAKGKPATLYFDEVRTPTYVECLIETIEQTACSHLKGILHAGGPRQLSLYQIAQIVNLVGGYDPDLLHGCYRIQAGPIPPRAGNVTMNSKMLENAVQRPPFIAWPADKSLVPDCRNWHYSEKLREQQGDIPTSSGLDKIVDQLYFRPFRSHNGPQSSNC